jgi:hypothetical protein
MIARSIFRAIARKRSNQLEQLGDRLAARIEEAVSRKRRQLPG